MKCPKCGAWNAAYLPKCTRCGGALPEGEGAPANWEEAMHEKKPALQVIQFDAGEENAPTPTDESAYDPERVDRAAITDELEELQRRRKAGAQRIRQMKEQADRVRRSVRETEIIRPVPEAGDMPSAYAGDSAAISRRQQQRQSEYLGEQTIAQSAYRPQESPYGYFGDPATERPLTYVDDEDAPIFYDGYTPERGDQAALTDEDYMPRRIQTRAANRDAYESYTATSRRRQSVLRLIGKVLLIALCCFAVGAGGVVAARHFVINQGLQVRQDNETRVELTEGETSDGHPSHTLTIYGRENATIYLSEMQSSYVIADGKVEVQIPDYMWYDTESSTFATEADDDTMDVTITPYIRYSQEGDQYQLEPVHFAIDVPLSPIYLLNPPAPMADVGVSIYEVRINVQLGSTVIIDGTNVSTLIRETGNVSKNVQVLPVGANTISISVKSKYCRENKMEITLNRAPQEIPLELAATVLVEWNYEATDPDPNHQPSISGTTLPGASISVEFPHSDLQVNSETGAFTFRPIFTQLGNNDVVIRASYEGRADSVITHTVYYMPNADIYTRRAWSLSDGYSDLINYIDMRKGTIYVGEGVIERIISTAPQLAIMNIGTTTLDKRVLLENSSKTTWEVGTSYRIYGDVYGLYDSMPRLTVRYTYLSE